MTGDEQLEMQMARVSGLTQSGPQNSWQLVHCYVGNRLTQMHNSSASAFRLVVNDIGQEIFSVWQSNPNSFYIHPAGAVPPVGRLAFKQMFQYEVADANTASVVSGTLGIPIVALSAGNYTLPGKRVMVNQTQLDKQIPNIRDLVARIE